MPDAIEPCPSCGEGQLSSPFTFSDGSAFTDSRRPFVLCADCGYRGPRRDTEKQAIAAHNRMSRAVTLVRKMAAYKGRLIFRIRSWHDRARDIMQEQDHD